MARAANKGYLSEPTAEFKAEVARTAALEVARNKLRAQWLEILGRLERAETSSALESTLIELKNYMVNNSAVPPDYKKADLVKLCRSKKLLNPENKKSKKTKPEWTTPVEIAYQALIFEYNKQLAPNNKVLSPLSLLCLHNSVCCSPSPSKRGSGLQPKAY